MKFEEIAILAQPLVLATAAEIDALESSLWTQFPAGYREYVTRLGEGILSDFVRIYGPWRIDQEYAVWRHRIGRYWFDKADECVLPKERALECFLLGDTTSGDEIVFHPTRPDRLFLLPRDSNTVIDLGGDLLSAIEWMCSSGELVQPISERTFEPFDSRDWKIAAGRNEVEDPAGESLEDLISAATTWAARHQVKAASKRALRRYVSKSDRATLLYEGIMFVSQDFEFKVGYSTMYKVVSNDGELRGIFRWSKGDGFEGSGFYPDGRFVR